MPRKARVVTKEDEVLSKEIGARLSAARSVLGLSAPLLAAQCGVSQAHQYKIESGQAVPDALYLYRLATRHSVSLDALLLGEASRSGRKDAQVANQTAIASAGATQIANVGGTFTLKRARA